MNQSLKKLFRFALIAGGLFAGLVVLLLIVAAIIIPIKFPPEKVKAMAVEKLSETLKRQVSIGAARFNVLSGFDIKNLKIANRPGWSEKPFVTAKDISISYHLWPLLWGEVSLGEIRLKQPQILVERRGLNNFNFSDMMGAPMAQAAPAPAPKTSHKTKTKKKTKGKKKHPKSAWVPAPSQAPKVFSFFADSAWADTTSQTSNAGKPSKTTLLLSVDSLNIIQANLEYLDETVSPVQKAVANDLNVKFKNISLAGGKITFAIDTPFTFNKLTYKLGLSGSLRYFLASQSIKNLDLKGTVNDLGFNLAGDALNMTTNFAPTMDGEASLEMLKFSGLVPKSLSAMPKDLSISGPAKVDFHLAGTIQSGLELSGVADGTELTVRYKDLFVKTTKTPCKVDFKSTISQDGSYDLPSFKVVYAKWEVTGAYHNRKGSPWTCEVYSKSLPFAGLPEMVPKLKNTTIDGGGSLDLKLTQALSSAAPFKAYGKVVLRGISITLPQEPYLQNMNGPILLEGTIARIPLMTFKSFDGSGAMGVTVNYGAASLAYTYGFSLKNVDGQKAINASVDAYVTQNPADYKDKIFGTMNLAYSGSGRGTSGDQMIASQTGTGNYAIDKGKVKGFPLIKAINGLFKDKSDEVSFERITGTLAMKNKVFSYTVNNSGKVGTLKAVGAINTVDMTYSPDMKIQGDIKKEFLDQEALKGQMPAQYRDKANMMDLIADDNGNIPLDFRFTGSVKKTPGLDCLDLSRAIKNVLNHLAKAAEKSAGQAVQQGVKDLGKQLKLW